jgi:hypothetical protein
VDDLALAIEAKATASVTSDHLRGLRELTKDQRKVRRRILVCLEARVRKTDDGIEILPYGTFVNRLWAGELAG